MNAATESAAGSEAPGSVQLLRHNRVELALHRVQAGDSHDHHPLLLLHGLGERTNGVPPGVVWPGAVFGLDFTGHGRSTIPVGGGYTSEILVGDVDAALVATGPVTVLGRGLGAYIGLLIGAARPDVVRGVVLADGPGLAGGGINPGSPDPPYPPTMAGGPPDPLALHELSRDVRPADYAQTFVRFVVEASDIDEPLFVAAVVRPQWLEAVAAEPGVGRGTIAEGLAGYTKKRPAE